MKIRNGFVSNSSSSSFVVYQKRVDLTKESRNKLNIKMLTDSCGFDEEGLKYALKHIPNNMVMIMASSIEHGNEDQIEIIAEKLINVISSNPKDFKVVIGDY